MRRVVALLALSAAACSHDWDAYDPRLGAGGSSSGGGGSTGATNAGGGAPSSTQTTGAGGDAPWFDDGLARRRPLDVARRGTTETLSDFPVLARLPPSTVNLGGELRFVDETQTVLAHEIERADENGESVVWVKLPSLGAATTRIWLYYDGTPESTALPPAEVWSNAFVAVWHFDSSAADATASHEGTATGAVPAAGWVGGGFTFDGAEDAVDVAADTAFDGLFTQGGTITSLTRPTNGGEMDRGRILDRTSSSTFTGGYSFLMSDYATPRSVGFAYAYADSYGWWTTAQSSIEHGAWQHVAVTFTEGDTAPKLYVDGQSQPLFIEAAPAGAPATVAGLGVRVGGRTGGTDRDYAGDIDELRVASTVRSASWVAAEWENVATGFVTLGEEEAR